MSYAARCSGALGYVLATVAFVACSGGVRTDLFDPRTTIGGTGSGGHGGAGVGAGGSSSSTGGDATGAGGATTTSAGGTTTTTTSAGGAGGAVGGSAGAGGASGGATGGAGGSGGNALDAGTNVGDAAAGGAGQGGAPTVDVFVSDACVPTGMEVCDGLDNDCVDGVDGRTCPDGCIGAARGTAGYMLCYGLNRHSTWHEASTACSSRGMHLVRVDDAEENAFIKEVARRVNFDGAIWLGGSDAADEGKWSWTDGTMFWLGDENGMAVGGNYVNWDKNTNQPGGTNQDCLEIQQNQSNWHDEDCGQHSAYVCEK